MPRSGLGWGWLGWVNLNSHRSNIIDINSPPAKVSPLAISQSFFALICVNVSYHPPADISPSGQKMPFFRFTFYKNILPFKFSG